MKMVMSYAFHIYMNDKSNICKLFDLNQVDTLHCISEYKPFFFNL